MAEQALGPGGTMARKRAFFGLLDANGWGWAIVKAAFWFVVIIMMMAYIPDRALYATVQPTIDLGVNLRVFNPALDVTPVSLCPSQNGQGSLPCPAPVGAPMPWQPSPAELNLPAPRTGGVIVPAGLQTLYVGGSDGSTAQDTVFATVVWSDGNMDPWSPGVALPAPRTQASGTFFAGVPYVIGGLGADGKPTDTVFAGTLDPATGKVTEWKESPVLKLPAPRAGATVVLGSDGLYLLGGTDGSGPTDTVWRAQVVTTTGKLGKWKPEMSMVQLYADGAHPAPRVHANATLLGTHLLVWGGEDAVGPTPTVLSGTVSPAKGSAGEITAWGTSNLAEQNIPSVHKGAFGWVANGSLYYAGGEGAQGQVWWAIPDSSGNIPGWKTLAASDLSATEDLRSAAAFVSGSHAFVVGGVTVSGVTGGIARADLAPKPPFFQVGLFYVVVPSLGIQGEVGQQLSYLAAAGVATTDFVILLLIGYA
jgi:hypothetical protein